MRIKPLRITSEICRLILAVTFIASGFTKVIDPWGTAIKVNEYLTIYGAEYLEPASMIFSIWLCGAELMMGCMLMCKVRIRLISIFALGSMAFFTTLTLLSATWIPVEDCGCFGDAVKLTSWQTFFKNLVLLPMACVVWYRYRHDKIFAFKPIEIVLTLFFFSLAMGLGLFCYRHLPLIDFLPYKVGVHMHNAINTIEPEPEDVTQTVLIYRNRETGKIREFALEDTDWQNDELWEWIDTRTTSEEPAIKPIISEFSLRDVEGDATDGVLTTPGRLYMICVTSFDKISNGCERRLGRLVRHAADHEATVVCITPDPLRSVTHHSFDGADGVRCYNADATVLKTMLRAQTGVVVLDDGVITSKKNCRDIRP